MAAVAAEQAVTPKNLLLHQQHHTHTLLALVALVLPLAGQEDQVGQRQLQESQRMVDRVELDHKEELAAEHLVEISMCLVEKVAQGQYM